MAQAWPIIVPMELLHRRIFLAGPVGRLEALFWDIPRNGASPPGLAAVVCHPNPLYGGTMHNKVVYHTAKTLHGFGLPVLRFNFRGVGLSEGVHDQGLGEQADVAAAIDFIAVEYPAAPLLLAGFSFGAATGLRAGCADARVVELIGLGLPLTDVESDKNAYLSTCKKPKLLLSGAMDIYSPRKNLESLARQLPLPVREQTKVQFIPNADHFFTGHLDELESSIAGWLTARHPNLALTGT